MQDEFLTVRTQSMLCTPGNTERQDMNSLQGVGLHILVKGSGGNVGVCREGSLSPATNT